MSYNNNKNHIEIFAYEKGTDKCIASTKVFSNSVLSKKIEYLKQVVSKELNVTEDKVLEHISIKNSENNTISFAA